MSHMEIEYKVMISESDFIKLDDALKDKPYTLYLQTNYYYDTIKRDLKKNKLSLRIRYIENKNIYIATLKEKTAIGNIEHEFVINDNLLSLLPEEITQIIANKNIDLSKLVQLASLKTKRKEYKDNDYILCLDYNEYNQTKDYEIECEAQSLFKAQEYIEKLLSSYNIKYSESLYSKSARAIKNS